MSLLLFFCFMVLELSSVAEVFAAEQRARENEKQWMRDAGAGIVGWADQYEELDKHTVPEAIGYENAKWKNHIERMYEEEGKDLNRVIFKNADGSRTQYIFDYPVKYKNENGEIKDSSFAIKDSTERGFKFETAASVSETRFPKDIRDGIELSGKDTQITLIPHDAKRSEPERIDEETISYICDENTTIEYSLTYTGFKEDIVVTEYTGQTEYEFTIYTEGLKLVEIDGSYYLVDENGEIKATIGDIIIFTADEKNNAFGELEAETIIENWEYRMKIVLDPEYLADEKTVYPIHIDPTVEITYDNDGAGAIEDVTINSLKGSSGSSGSLSVGLREKYGISRILMKFPGLDLSSLGSNVEITNATVELRDLMCEGTNLTVSCYVFSGNTWTESTANWSNVSPNSISTFLSSQTITYATGKNLSPKHRYSFDITEAVKGWKAGNYNQEKGIIFKASSALESGSTYDCRTIASYNRSSNKPSLSVTYSSSYNLLANNTYYLNNKNCGNYLRYTSSSATGQSGLLSSLGTSIQWEVAKADGGYVIRSKADTTKYLAVPTSTSSSSVSIVTVSDSAIPTRCIWTISMAYGWDGYLLKNNYNSRYLYTYGTTLYTSTNTEASGTSAYNSRVWRLATTSSYGNTSAYANRELTSSFSISSMTLDIDQSATPTINKYPSTARWATASDFTYTTSSTGVTIDNTTHEIKGYTGGTYTVTATHKVTNLKKTFSVKVNKTAIIIIPGFAGTMLIAGNDVPNVEEGTVVWDVSLATELKAGTMSVTELGYRLEALRCNADGTSKYDIVAYPYQYGAANTYKNLYSSIEKEYGDQYIVKFWAYDWRLSNAVSAEKLDAYIEANKYDKVVLVAHSMGGLVASAYVAMGEEQQSKVKTLITLGSPLMGTPVAPYVWGSEDIGEIFTDIKGSTAESVLLLLSLVNYIDGYLNEFESVYEVFPNEQYFTEAGKPYLTIINPNTMRFTLATYEATQQQFLISLPLYRGGFAQKANEFQKSLYDGEEHITSLVDSYYIAGYGYDTVIGIGFDSKVWVAGIGEAKGDTVVPYWSACLNERYPDRSFYIVGNENAYLTHTDLMNDVDVQQFVNNLIVGNTSVSEFEYINTDIE